MSGKQRDPSIENVHGYRYLRPVGKPPTPKPNDVYNTPAPKPNTLARAVFPPLGFRDPRLEN
jgi:hypothetical protein